MFALRLALRNVTSRKSSIVIVMFIAFAISMFLLANAIFDSADSGLERTFVESFTGDVVARPATDFPLSLFGDDTPATGELSAIPHLIPYTDIFECVSRDEDVEAAVPQFTAMAEIMVNGDDVCVSALFGVDAVKYTSMMGGIELLEGSAFAPGEKGIMLNETVMRQINDETGLSLGVGDEVQLVTASGVSATIRALPIRAVYKYPARNASLDKISIVDAATARDLMGARDVSASVENIDSDERNLMEESSSGDFDDLFSDAEDVALAESAQEYLERSIQEDGGEAEKTEEIGESAVWNFILCKAKSARGADKMAARLNKAFKKNGWAAQAVRWRAAAGGSVNLVYYLRVISNVGIALVLLIGFVVVNNTLVVSALGRVAETGALRAIGASRSFVASQFLLESAALAICAGVAGCLLGSLMTVALSAARIQIANDYLAQLFGGSVLTSRVTARNVAGCMALSAVLALIGSMAPARAAMESSPVEAMRGQA